MYSYQTSILPPVDVSSLFYLFQLHVFQSELLSVCKWLFCEAITTNSSFPLSFICKKLTWNQFAFCTSPLDTKVIPSFMSFEAFESCHNWLSNLYLKVSSSHLPPQSVTIGIGLIWNDFWNWFGGLICFIKIRLVTSNFDIKCKSFIDVKS